MLVMVNKMLRRELSCVCCSRSNDRYRVSVDTVPQWEDKSYKMKKKKKVMKKRRRSKEKDLRECFIAALLAAFEKNASSGNRDPSTKAWLFVKEAIQLHSYLFIVHKVCSRKKL